MMKIYDSNHNFLQMIMDGLKDVYTTEVLEVGLKSLHFQVPCLPEYLQLLQEENYVETKDYEYIIKELIEEDNGFFTVWCAANIEEISGELFEVFDCYMKNPQQAYEYCLQQSPAWTVDYHSSDHTALTIQKPMQLALDMIREIQEQTNQEIWFDTKNKVLRVYDRMGEDNNKWYYSNQLKLQNLSKQSSTYDYATVLYPIGKDGLDIKWVNNNLPFIENYTYTNKRIVKVWRNDEITVAERLKGAAQDYLDSIAQPKASYKVALSELDAGCGLGDTIYLVDNLKKIKQKQRIVKIVRYPFEPENDSVELSNIQGNFARTFVKQQKVMKKEIDYIKKIIEEMGQNRSNDL